MERKGDKMKDDTISRAAALDFVSAMNFCGEISDEAYQKLTVHFENLPSAQPRWIPCGVALPEKEGVYLVTDKTAYGEKISMRYWNIHEKDAFWSGYESDVVTAWMPLPTPYREGEQA